jgi:TonB family protein
MERMMLNDPFLSDAIEGLQEIKDPEKLKDTLSEIEDLIESNYGKRRVLVPIYKNPLAIAAVISLLIISAAVVLLVPDYRQKVQSLLITEKDKEASELPESKAQEDVFSEKEEPQEEMIASDTSLQNFDEQPVLTNLDPALNAEQPSESPESTEPVSPTSIDSSRVDEQDILIAGEGTPSIDQPIIDTVSIQLATNDVAGEAEQPEEFAEIKDELISEDQDVAGAKRAAPETLARQTEMPMLKEVSGIVTAQEDNQPIPGVNVIVNGTSKGTITNANGTYSLQLLEDENEIQFSFIGFQPYDLSVTNAGTYNVGMSSDTEQLSEVVVIGYGAGDVRTEGSDKFAAPETSRTAYNRYLRDNLVYPDSAIDNNISGRVVVQFTVGTDGSISNLEVTRSLGFGCDEEAMRLILEGPGWQPAIRNGIGVEERVRVAVRFNP